MKSLKLFLISAFGSFTSLSAFAQETMGKSFDEKINDAIAPIISPFVNMIFSPLPGSEEHRNRQMIGLSDTIRKFD